MKRYLVASCCLPNPDGQIWRILIPGVERQEGTKPFEDETEGMIERGED